ncbi:MAG: tetratricopeptide repeat protein [Acidobacteriaceae bacterium]|nr:tetratricopeptide repeat protein [Acidobacteriaceae bacterium]
MLDTDIRPVTEDAMAALQSVLSSPPFQRSGRLSAFLRFIAEERLSGREEGIKEYELGVRVFNRPEDYNPQTDPIVRVQARQLRYKLREYYETLGAGDRVRIELPKGSYLPFFRYTPDALPASTEPIAATQETSQVSVGSGDGNVLSRSRNDPKLRLLLIAAAILVVLSALFVWRERHATPGAGAHVPDPEAKDLYLKGRYYWSKRNPEALKTAVDYFTQAIVRDPNYAKAYVGLADSYNLLREFAAMPADEAFTRATAAAKRAVALDNESAEAHTSLGFCLFWGAWNQQAGLREFERAIELNPNYVTAHHWYATALLTAGRPQQALTEIERARDLDSTSTAILSDEGLILFFAGQQSRAIDLLKQVEAADPSFMSPHAYLARVFLIRQDFPNFIKESGKAAYLSHDESALLVAQAAESGFSTGDSRRMLENMLKVQKDLFTEGKGSAYSIARTASLLGKRDEAFAYLQTALNRREMLMLDLRMDLAFANLHADPAWPRFVASIPLPDQ